ncbi:alpha/beta hydrolase [Pedobacter chinensis]|uniref:Alpha/beta hydrolase n=1 Tax=Pedobacter chinensis TaxID=2282421 RepID=A0A369PSC2_9SPHI|nr:alpha/beta hydrolase [Pedobacter chinensis]RDC55160.1 alpha/beta hydrolase [Pedobacter chinensis]
MEYQPLKYIYQPAQIANASTLLLLHGTGGNEMDLLPLAIKFGSNINVLSVRGNVSENGMPRFFKRLGMGVFDEQDLLFRTAELVSFLTEVSSKERFDLKKIIALGYSNGANIAGALLVNYPDFLNGAILFRPMQPYQQLPEYRSKAAKPVFLSSGRFDPTVDGAATEGYVASLRDHGYQTAHHILNSGHNLTSEDINLAVEWFGKNFS